MGKTKKNVQHLSRASLSTFLVTVTRQKQQEEEVRNNLRSLFQSLKLQFVAVSKPWTWRVGVGARWEVEKRWRSGWRKDERLTDYDDCELLWAHNLLLLLNFGNIVFCEKKISLRVLGLRLQEKLSFSNSCFLESMSWHIVRHHSTCLLQPVIIPLHWKRKAKSPCIYVWGSNYWNFGWLFPLRFYRINTYK